jgi:hypothetical protein
MSMICRRSCGAATVGTGVVQDGKLPPAGIVCAGVMMGEAGRGVLVHVGVAEAVGVAEGTGLSVGVGVRVASSAGGGVGVLDGMADGVAL